MSELSFEQMFEESSFKRLRTGEAVTGQVIGVKEDEIILSIAGSKSEGIITRSEFTNEPGVDLRTKVQVGDELEAKVLKVNDGEGMAALSYKRLAADKGLKRLKEAFENGTSVAWANDNTEVIAFALQNEGYTVGIPSLGSADTIAPAVSKGNTTLLDWINDEIVALGEENFFHADYEATLADTYGLDYEDSLVVEGGKVNAQ